MDTPEHRYVPDPIPLNLERRLGPDKGSLREFVAIGDIMPGKAAILGEGFSGEVVRQRVNFLYERDGELHEYEDVLAIKYYRHERLFEPDLSPRQQAEQEFNSYCIARDAGLPVLPICLLDRTKPIVAMYDYSEDGKFAVTSLANESTAGKKREKVETIRNLEDTCRKLLACAAKAANAGMTLSNSTILFRVPMNTEKNVQLQFVLADFGEFVHKTDATSEEKKQILQFNERRLAEALQGWIEDNMLPSTMGVHLLTVNGIMRRVL